MFLKINHLKIHYQTSGEGKTVVLLHGWRDNLQNFVSLYSHLKKDFKVFSIDLPGFGKSDLPNTVWNTSDYAHLIMSFFEQLQIKNPILIGHSFGGKISTQIATSIPLDKLVLVNSSGIKPTRKLSYYFKVMPRKIAKKIVEKIIPKKIANHIIEFSKKRIGSDDYRNASGIIREILIKTVNDDVRSFLPNIKTPTLLIWGENDKETPVSSGKLMSKLIPNSKLIILKNTGHFPYLEKFDEFITNLDVFLKEELS